VARTLEFIERPLWHKPELKRLLKEALKEKANDELKGSIIEVMCDIIGLSDTQCKIIKSATDPNGKVMGIYRAITVCEVAGPVNEEAIVRAIDAATDALDKVVLPALEAAVKARDQEALTRVRAYCNLLFVYTNTFAPASATDLKDRIKAIDPNWEIQLPIRDIFQPVPQGPVVSRAVALPPELLRIGE
jgi:hypothetical protein